MLVNKDELVKLIKKVHLDEINNELVLNFEGEKITAPFRVGDTMGIITVQHKLKEDSSPFKMYVKDITKLLKSLSVFSGVIELNVNSIGNYLIAQFKDDKFTNDFRLSDASVLDYDHESMYTLETPEPDIQINLTKEVIADICKMKKTLKSEDTSTITLKSIGERRLELIVGDFNKIKYDLRFTKLKNMPLDVNVKFNLNKFFSILDNNNDAISGTISYKKPFIKLELNNENYYSATYYLLQNQ